ncbi:MAG: hypothetical protein E5Y62_27240 [Mesorhizobium sp.]|nr:MAG: hypothetical protein E5Y62_27240 [Mesorhizobium sp.]
MKCSLVRFDVFTGNVLMCSQIERGRNRAELPCNCCIYTPNPPTTHHTHQHT